jgi:hypothetical protein
MELYVFSDIDVPLQNFKREDRSENSVATDP